MTINPNNPADTAIISQHPADERDMRTSLLVDHDDEGRHEKLTLEDKAGATPSGTASFETLWQEGGTLFRRSGTGSVVQLGVVPVGGIVIWSGSVASIPSGWVICDGTNGTPDLRGRFVKGVDPLGAPNVDQTGGSETHDHGGATGAHALTTLELPSHQHPAGTLATSAEGAHAGHFVATGGTDEGDTGTGTAQVDATVTDHTHTITGDTGSRGGGQSHDHTISSINHEPPWYALAYIMFTG